MITREQILTEMERAASHLATVANALDSFTDHGAYYARKSIIIAVNRTENARLEFQTLERIKD